MRSTSGEPSAVSMVRSASFSLRFLQNPAGGSHEHMTLEYVEELKAKAKALSISVINRWEKQHGGAPDVLWHYTGQLGFEGMSSSSEIWLTNALFLTINPS